MTWRPQADNTIATTTTTRPNQRYIFTSRTARATALALASAFALHFAFPRANVPWLAPLALGGLFAAWMMLPPRAAAAVGYVAGLVFFSLSFAWFGETAGALLGPLAPLLDIGPALLEATAFALAAAITSVAATQLRGFWVVVVTAAAYTGAEFLRSTGMMGAPLYQIGAAFVETPLAPLAAFAGVYAITFAVALIGAAIGRLVIKPGRATLSAALCTIGAIAALSLLAGATWPARHIPAGTLRVAAVQGNIRQSVKWQAQSLAIAVERYTTLTSQLQNFGPRFVLWPETVITTDLRLDPGLTAVRANAGLVRTDRELDGRFRALARSLDAVIAVGSDEATTTKPYDSLFFYTPRSAAVQTYRKRQLVPFAEFLPGPKVLRNLPLASLVSDFGAGTQAGPFDSTLRVAPLICWEAGFGDLAQAQAAGGARFFAIATDDAWFGDSDGPYAQAQLAQVRAIETGRWIVRAAATGISGIIAPDGRWRARSTLDTQAVVTGTIGEPQPTVYSAIGPYPIAGAMAVLTVLSFAFGRRRVR